MSGSFTILKITHWFINTLWLFIYDFSHIMKNVINLILATTNRRSVAIKSFIIYPRAGEKQNLSDKLVQMPQCEVHPSLNKDVIVLVTACESKEEDEDLMIKLNNYPELDYMTLVSGFE